MLNFNNFAAANLANNFCVEGVGCSWSTI